MAQLAGCRLLAQVLRDFNIAQSAILQRVIEAEGIDHRLALIAVSLFDETASLLPVLVLHVGILEVVNNSHAV